jgi:hypothetical protein
LQKKKKKKNQERKKRGKSVNDCIKLPQAVIEE